MTRLYNPPLQVVGFVGTRRGDADRGPQVRLRAEEAALRMLIDGELAWVQGPRRQELATVVIDDAVPKGGVVVRDVAGAGVSEIVRLVKPDLDRATRTTGMTGTPARDGTAFATQVRARRAAAPRSTDAPVVTPLVQSVNFIQAIGTAEGLRYPRYGNAPNAESLQRRLSVLEGAEAALVMASGMGATVCALLALLRPGDHLLASQWLYGGVRRLLEEEFPNFGITSRWSTPPRPASGGAACARRRGASSWRRRRTRPAASPTSARSAS